MTTDKDHGLGYRILKAGDDAIEQNLPWLKDKFDRFGITSATKRAAETGDAFVGKAGEQLVEFGSGEFMKKYGYTGALVFTYMTLFRGSDWKLAGLVAGIASFLFGNFINPLIENMLSNSFNTVSGAGPAPSPPSGIQLPETAENLPAIPAFE